MVATKNDFMKKKNGPSYLYIALGLVCTQVLFTYICISFFFFLLPQSHFFVFSFNVLNLMIYIDNLNLDFGMVPIRYYIISPGEYSIF